MSKMTEKITVGDMITEMADGASAVKTLVALIDDWFDLHDEYDGLSSRECACTTNDLCPCCEINTGCVAVHTQNSASEGSLLGIHSIPDACLEWDFVTIPKKTCTRKAGRLMSETRCPVCGSREVTVREYKKGDRLDEAPNAWLAPLAVVYQRDETRGETEDYWIAEMDFGHLRCQSCGEEGWSRR